MRKLSFPRFLVKLLPTKRSRQERPGTITGYYYYLLLLLPCPGFSSKMKIFSFSLFLPPLPFSAFLEQPGRWSYSSCFTRVSITVLLTASGQMGSKALRFFFLFPCLTSSRAHVIGTECGPEAKSLRRLPRHRVGRVERSRSRITHIAFSAFGGA